MMKRSAITKNIAPVLKGYGYVYSRGMFVKTRGEVAAGIYLHKCPFGDMMDVDVGVGPWRRCFAWPPEVPSDLGVFFNAERTKELRDHPVFMMLGDGLEPYPDELHQALSELAEWIDAVLLDEQRLRALILDERSFLSYRATMAVFAREWAGQTTWEGKC